jgi:hypothetical protein
MDSAEARLVEYGQTDLVPHEHMRGKVAQRLATVAERPGGQLVRCGKLARGRPLDSGEQNIVIGPQPGHRDRQRRDLSTYAGHEFP